MNLFPKNIICKILLVMGLMVYNNLNGQNLDQHKWTHRILLIQASEESSKLQTQLVEFSNSLDELEERKLIVYQFAGNKYRIINLEEGGLQEEWKFLDKAVEKQGFRVILIGLDGSIKLEKTSVISKEELYNIIDSMPMRMSELKYKKHD